METLAELRAREEEVEREWQWLHDTINDVARARADQKELAAVRLLHDHAMRVGQRRIELRLKMAAIEGPGGALG
jgi:hypothetical protein